MEAKDHIETIERLVRVEEKLVANSRTNKLQYENIQKDINYIGKTIQTTLEQFKNETIQSVKGIDDRQASAIVTATSLERRIQKLEKWQGKLVWISSIASGIFTFLLITVGSQIVNVLLSLVIKK